MIPDSGYPRGRFELGQQICLKISTHDQASMVVLVLIHALSLGNQIEKRGPVKASSTQCNMLILK